MVDLDELEKLLLTNWTKFINPQKLIAFVLTNVRDSELPTLKGSPPSQNKSLKITISHFSANSNRTFTVWVEFVIPKATGLSIGTCELKFDPFTGELTHLQTLGTILT